MAVEHRFGNPSTELKLEVVESYLRAFTMALRNKWPELWYIDGFAGTGSRVVDFPAREQDLLHEPVAARVERLRGSAQIALEVEPPFKRVIFIEEKPTFCAELERLTSEHKGREIEIWRGEANTEIVEHCHETDWSGKRAVMFLDPYGMEVSLNTLQAIQSTEAIDLWYLFSLEGLYRQAARRMENIDDAKAEAITRMLGTNDWKEALYRPSGQLNFLDEASHAERTGDLRSLEEFVRARLSSLFPAVLEPLWLPPRVGPRRFLLYFAVSNPAGEAIGLATRIASHILRAGISSQVRSR